MANLSPSQIHWELIPYDLSALEREWIAYAVFYRVAFWLIEYGKTVSPVTREN